MFALCLTSCLVVRGLIALSCRNLVLGPRRIALTSPLRRVSQRRLPPPTTTATAARQFLKSLGVCDAPYPKL